MDEISEEPRPQRTQLRLRALISELQAGVRETRTSLQGSHLKIDTLAERVDDLAREVQALKAFLAGLANGDDT
jgi:hypothetical protein